MKISLISLSEIAAKCNVSPVDEPQTRDVVEREEKKSGRDVKIRRNEKKEGCDKGKYKKTAGVQEPESVRVFQIFYFYLRWQKERKSVRKGRERKRKSELIELENATYVPELLPFSSSFSLAPPIKLRTYKREGLTATVDLRSGEILPKRGEPHRGVHLCPVSF